MKATRRRIAKIEKFQKIAEIRIPKGSEFWGFFWKFEIFAVRVCELGEISDLVPWKMGEIWRTDFIESGSKISIPNLERKF